MIYIRYIQKIFMALLFASIAACAHYPLNQQSEIYNTDTGYRFDNLTQEDNSDSLFICLAFSGGGTRAAAFSYGIMDALFRTKIVLDGVEKSLLDEVDCISSVSGGSFTAAYYGSFGEQLFADFRTEFLERDIQGAIGGRVLSPANWFRLASPNFSRIDIAAELYDEEIFRSKRFADLQDRGRPFLILNATNLESGARFDFTHLHFDAMGSDLENYPVARAVAASSAFPILLSPISLVNYPQAPGYAQPWWYDGALESLHSARYRYQAARDLSYYFDKDHRYVHLMDGGLADNIGVRGIYHEFSRGFIRSRINDNRIDRLVVIVVNAATDPHEKLSERESPPDLIEVATKTATISIDNYSVESITLMVESLRQRVQAQQDLTACQNILDSNCPDPPTLPTFGKMIDPYIIEINFAGAAELEGEDPDYYLNLPTSYKLDQQQIERLVNIGPKLLRSSPQYQCLIEVIQAEAQGRPRPDECEIGAGIAGF
jgi:NTE family protein